MEGEILVKLTAEDNKITIFVNITGSDLLKKLKSYVVHNTNKTDETLFLYYNTMF